MINQHAVLMSADCSTMFWLYSVRMKQYLAFLVWSCFNSSLFVWTYLYPLEQCYLLQSLLAFCDVLIDCRGTGLQFAQSTAASFDLLPSRKQTDYSRLNGIFVFKPLC